MTQDKGQVPAIQRFEVVDCIDSKHVPAVIPKPHGPSAAVALSDDLRDRLVAISAAIADQDDRAAQAMLREILAAPQPSTTPPADSHPAPVLLSDEELCQIEEPYLLNFRIPLGGQYDFARAVEKAVLAKTYGTQAPQPSPTPQADSQPAPVVDYPPLPEPDLGMPWRVNAKSDGAAHSSGFTCEQMRAYVDADRAARAPADSVLEDAARLERERICAAIKAEDDYCVDHGDYMLDSDDCIKIVRGEWVRPDFAVDAARKQGANHD